MAFEAGSNVSMSPEVFGTTAPQLVKAYNLTDGSARTPPNYMYAFAVLRVDKPGSDWSMDVDALEKALHLKTS